MLLAEKRNDVTRSSRWGGAVLGVALALVLAGCSSDSPDVVERPDGQDEVEQPAPDDSTGDVTGLTAGDIIAAIEPHGFACEEKDSPIKGREEVVECRADDYVFITATRLVSEDLVQPQLEAAKRAICESELGDGMRTAVSDTWILVPGGDRDKDIAAFDAAMTSLGLDWTEDLC